MQDGLKRLSPLFDPPTAPFWAAAIATAAILVLTFILIETPAAPRKAPQRAIVPVEVGAAKRDGIKDGIKTEPGPKRTSQDAASASGKPQGAAPPPAVKGFLRIASWNVEAVPLLSGRFEDKKRASWRTSFGSERLAPARKVYEGRVPEADVILLQGISDATLLRRSFFPAGDWHLIVQRRALASTSADVPPVGTTGIAIRARPDLRITAREYSIGGEVGRAARDPSSADRLLGTAVRVLDRGRVFWLAAVSIPPDCPEAPRACPARARLLDWQESKRQRGEAAIVGGQFAPEPEWPGPEKRLCGRQTFRTDMAITGPWTVTEDRLGGPGAGCALAIDLKADEIR